MDFPHKAFCPPPFSCSAPLQSNSHFHTGLSFGFVLPPLRTHSLHTSQVWFHCVRSAHRCWRLPSELESRVLLCCCKPKAPGGFFLSARFHCIFFPFSSLRLSFQPTQKFCRLYFFCFISAFRPPLACTNLLQACRRTSVLIDGSLPPLKWFSFDSD